MIQNELKSACYMACVIKRMHNAFYSALSVKENVAQTLLTTRNIVYTVHVFLLYLERFVDLLQIVT